MADLPRDVQDALGALERLVLRHQIFTMEQGKAAARLITADPAFEFPPPQPPAQAPAPAQAQPPAQAPAQASAQAPAQAPAPAPAPAPAQAPPDDAPPSGTESL